MSVEVATTPDNVGGGSQICTCATTFDAKSLKWRAGVGINAINASDAAKLGKQLGSILNFPCQIIAFCFRLALLRFYWRAASAFGKSRF